jgi:DNA-binding cell septation regulator SpoVG
MEARFYEPKYKDGKIVAFADVEVDRGVIIRGFRVINGANGLFGAPPSRKVTIDGETQYKHQVVFDTNDHRDEFMAKLLRDYESWKQNRSEQASTA